MVEAVSARKNGSPMATLRTSVTELGTAAGMVLGDDHDDLTLLEALEIPGIEESVWRPYLETAAEDGHHLRSILKAALANGAAFRANVLKGRDPDRIEWRGTKHTLWVSDSPADLTVNQTINVSAKYDSKCFLNRAPAALFQEVLSGTIKTKRPDWYRVVAPAAYDAFYLALVLALEEQGTSLVDFPTTPAELTKSQRQTLKWHMKTGQKKMPEPVAAAYQQLSSAVSVASAAAWRDALAAANDTVRMSMLAQMLRISGTTYWLLGHAAGKPVRHQVVSTHRLREVYRLKTFTVIERPDAGQPRVDWQAVLQPKKGAPQWATPRTVTASARCGGRTRSSRATRNARSSSRHPLATSPYLPL